MASIIAEPTINDPKRTRQHLPLWIEAVNEMLREHHEALCRTNGWSGGEPKTVSIGKGRKYIKVLDNHGIFAFIRAADGAILKAATWKAPALNHIRGSIFEPNVNKAVTPYGVRYMDDPALKCP